MRGKVLLAAFLLAVGLCFVPISGYAKVEQWMNEAKAKYMECRFSHARISYIMSNPTTFLKVHFYYDPVGQYRRFFPEGIDTKGKIFVEVRDNRGVFSDKPGTALLEKFKSVLEPIYTFIQSVATDMDTDIVAKFYSRENIPLGYFYQGKYHLWEKG